MTLVEMWEGLARERVRFVIVGGVAGVAHGSVRRTEDLDICYDTSPDNVERLATLLTAWHARLHLPSEPDARLPFTIDVRTFRDSPVLTLRTDLGRLDLMDQVTGVGDYTAAVAKSQQEKFGTVELRVLTLDALIASKRAAGRDRDLEHLIELEALRVLKRELAKPAPRRARRRRSR